MAKLSAYGLFSAQSRSSYPLMVRVSSKKYIYPAYKSVYVNLLNGEQVV
jgi:hypothetical protein